MRRFSSRLSILALAVSLSACSGGSGSLPVDGASQTGPVPSGGGSNGSGGSTALSNGQVRVTASLSNSGLPQFAAISRKSGTSMRRALATSFQSLVFRGTIYPGYAGAVTQTATSTLNATSLPSTVGLTFSNVPAGNNEWVVISVTAYSGQNATGSSAPIGQLGGLFNVGTTASITVDNGSTERLQLALAGMYDGMISTYELSNQTSLDSDLGNFIGSSGMSTDPNTGLFNSTAITRLLDNLLSSYTRQLTINGSFPDPSTAYVTWNYTSTSELDYAASVTATSNSLAPFDVALIAFPEIYGNPNATLFSTAGTATQPSTPSSTGTPATTSVQSDGFDANSGSVKVPNVYGGALLVGVATSANLPLSSDFGGNGGFASVAGRARNSSASVAVSESTTYLQIQQNDPEADQTALELYYGQFGQYEVTVAPVDNIYGLVCHAAVCRGSNAIGYVGSNASDANYYVDQFNPWALPSSKLAFCLVVTAECSPLSTSTVTTHTPFLADTTDGDAWPIVVPSSGAGATTSVTNGNPDTIKFSTGTAPASGYVNFNLSGNPVYFFGGQHIDIVVDVAEGSRIYFNIGCGGTTYQSTSLVDQNGNADITILGFSGLVTCQSVQVGYTLDSTAKTGTFNIGHFTPPSFLI